MRIGIDLHGVLNVNAKISRSFLKLLNDTGNVIHVISGPPTEQVKKELKELGLEKGTHYRFIHSIVDFLKDSKVKMWQDEKEEWWADEKSWWSSKGKICRIYNIDIMIDDREEHKKYFTEDHPTKFILFERS